MMRPTLRLAALILASLTGALAMPALGQPIVVTAGEHADFTRIVLYSARGFTWQTHGDGPTIRLQTESRPLRMDRARSLDRIPRQRVVDLRIVDGALQIDLACLCPVRTYEDRPGVVVLDVLNANPDVTRTLLPQDIRPIAPNDGRSAAGAAARTAGQTLALAMTTQAQPPNAHVGPLVPGGLGDDPNSTLSGLAHRLAVAMTQGLVTPLQPSLPQVSLLGPAGSPDTALPDLPANMRLRNASDAISDETPVDLRSTCPTEEVLAFTTALQDPDFSRPLASLNAQLFGEFDTPDTAVLTRLVEHYLVWGLGAEARQLLDQATIPITGRDILTAIADVLDARHSNARQRLAGLLTCPGPTDLFAALAGAEPDRVRPLADSLTAGYQRLSPGLREAIGPDLVVTLLSAGAVDPARITLDSYRRSESPDTAVILRLTALVDRARNDTARARQRLESADPGQIATLEMVLDLALAESSVQSSDRLADAAALAATYRGSDAGRRVMELTILHQGRAGLVRQGFENLATFEGWLEPTPSAASRILTLRRALWRDSLSLADPDFLDLVLTRDDWRGRDLDPEVLLGLAQRFDDLGLSGLAEETRWRADRSDPLNPTRDGPYQPGPMQSQFSLGSSSAVPQFVSSPIESRLVSELPLDVQPAPGWPAPPAVDTSGPGRPDALPLPAAMRVAAAMGRSEFPVADESAERTAPSAPSSGDAVNLDLLRRDTALFRTGDDLNRTPLIASGATPTTDLSAQDEAWTSPGRQIRPASVDGPLASIGDPNPPAEAVATDATSATVGTEPDRDRDDATLATVARQSTAPALVEGVGDEAATSVTVTDPMRRGIDTLAATEQLRARLAELDLPTR